MQRHNYLASYSLLDALRGRRSRRFGLGMAMAGGPLAYRASQAPLPLTDAEEAHLAFAATGVTGYALGDLNYAPGQGGTIMVGLRGSTVASADAIHAVALVVVNDEATYLLKRPQDFAAAEIPELVRLAQAGAFTELYARSRVRLRDGRAAPPAEPPFTMNINRWSLYPAGSTYFLPINELTFMYVNGLLELFDEAAGYFVLDERASFRPAGLRQFARSRGGHLDDDPGHDRVATIHHVELAVCELVTIEQGMVLQNLGLMAQALGLGGFPHLAAHETGWFQALGFRLGQMPASRYLGASPLLSTVVRLLGRDRPATYPLGLERDSQVLLKPYCPPYYRSMAEAVRAVVEVKTGPQGVFQTSADRSAWRDGAAISAATPPVSESAIEATIAYCEYVHNRYGRFPAYPAPFRTVLGYQALHVDTDFYDHFYQPQALTDTQREHLPRWHAEAKG
jgi:hypothetical protein